jgi:hypothetical protein
VYGKLETETQSPFSAFDLELELFLEDRIEPG